MTSGETDAQEKKFHGMITMLAAKGMQGKFGVEVGRGG